MKKTIDIIEYEPVFLVRASSSLSLSLSKKFHPHHALTNPKDSYPRTCSNVHTLVVAIHSLSFSLSLLCTYALLVILSLFIQMFYSLRNIFFLFFFRCYTGYTGFYNLIVQLFNNETYKINIYCIFNLIYFISCL